MRRYIYIGLGGVAGAILRYWVSRAQIPNHLNIPFAVILINALGCFAIGWVLTVFIGLHWNKNLRAGVSIGFLGAFTTFSTACRQMFDLIHTGNWLLAVVYAFISVILGFTAAFLGVSLGNALVQKKQKARKATESGESEAE
jgi:Integral membrane protein possibly involved in chromosome condensation